MIELPFLTSDLGAIEGRFKTVPEDFQVDEVPIYLPSGSGEHLFLLVEKEGRNTMEVASEIARALGAHPKDVGVAGQKDRQARTTQWISVPSKDRDAALALQGEGYRILEAAFHGNKLRTGHLRGNRFQIRLRGLAEGDFPRLRAILDALEARGLPNAYGSQRFGSSGENAEQGRRLLVGDAPKAARHRNPKLRRFLVSAFQSEVFNRVLGERMRRGTWDEPQEGDVLVRLESGGLFLCASPEEDRPRVESFECSVTGPLPGAKMWPRPEGEPAALEEEILAQTGVTAAHLAAASRDAPGARRPLRIPIRVEAEEEAVVEPQDAAASGPDASGGVERSTLLRFELPAGSYATAVLRELFKA